MSFISQFWLQLLEVVRHLGPVEIIDVIVVTFVLYQLLRLLRGTQGTQILVGLVLLAVVGFVSTTFNLILLSWLFRNATFFIIIAVIVMFQPELRRAFDQLGRMGNIGRPLSRCITRQCNQAISEGIRAAERLGTKRTGALIAFEREVGLEDYAATGVRINGEISAEFLQSIFYPHSPLHDGAVIVRGDRVLAAGCVLPLAESIETGHQFGTRHRAAIGISAKTDALAVVVSEETGRISIANNGRLVSNFDEVKLRRVLPMIY